MVSPKKLTSPAITIGEAAAALAAAVLLGPHDPVAFTAVEAAIFAANRTRRSTTLRGMIAAQQGLLREVLALLPVPPVAAEERPLLVAPPAPRLPEPDVSHPNEKYPEDEYTPPPSNLTFDAFLSLVNDDPDEAPHLFIAGTSGAGKTVLAQAIAASRDGYVVILDPKRPQGWKAAKWGGLPYISRDTNGTLAPMVAALKQVVKEMERRYKAQETAKAPFPTITLIVDEGRNVVEEAPEVATYYKRIISIGREVGVRLILISTTDRAGKLGFAGEADSLQSLTPVRLGQFAVPYLGKSIYSGGRPYTQAVIFARGQWVPFDNRTTLTYVEHHKMEPSCVWSGVNANCQQRNEPIAIGCERKSEMRFLSDLLSEEVAPSRTSGVVLSRTSDVDHSDPVGVEVSGVLTKATTSASSGKRRIREPLKVLQTEGDLPQVEVLQLAKKALHLATSRQLSKTKAITLVTGYAGGGLWAAVAACYDTLQGEL